MPTFPRSRNGHVDNGQRVTSGERCPNCGSLDYKQTTSTEDCPACGLHCDYWGGGANEVYQAMMNRKNEAERREGLAREIRSELENN